MTRSELWEWLGTCPEKTWFIVDDNMSEIKIYFVVDENPDEEEACQ